MQTAGPLPRFCAPNAFCTTSMTAGQPSKSDAARPLLQPNPVASGGHPGQNESSNQVRPTSCHPPRRSSGMKWLRLLLAAAVLLSITAISNADYVLIRYTIGGKKTD